ncbi:site-specific integrase [Aliarcobacter butzleri]|uniref:Site-specific integrase n=1 Tax=Aliarcobacter butzleri TaxID=28197 RepID=A0AAW6VQF3_9BACT|nr:site-specific integrase [Aliarcobacter butzleri]MDK2062755.1 site-specific integrase [Aliarcobacter butzleri]
MTARIKTPNELRAEKGKEQIGRKVGTVKANRALKEKDFLQLMEFIKNDKDTRLSTLNKYKKIFTFLFYTGCRINEVLKLKTEDIQNILEHGEARILTTKTGRFKGQEFRTVYFSTTAIATIKEIFADILHNKNSYCIRAWNNKDKEMNPIGLANQINKYLEKVFGHKDFTTHSFRRGIITEMILDKDIKPEIVQAFIGHKNYATTTRYVKPSVDDIKNSLTR